MASCAGDGAERNDLFGASLATGDMNGDGFADLAIGIRQEGVGTQVRIYLPILRDVSAAAAISADESAVLEPENVVGKRAVRLAMGVIDSVPGRRIGKAEDLSGRLARPISPAARKVQAMRTLGSACHHGDCRSWVRRR